MRITYDEAVDAAYIYLVESIAPGGVARTVVPDIELHAAAITIDLDDHDRILGIEVLGVTRVLAHETLKIAA